MIEKTCKYCKTTLRDFYSTGMVGCEHCYTVFMGEVEAYIKKCQYNNIHVGKTPAITGEDKALLQHYNELVAEKERAGIEGRIKDKASIAQ